MQKGVRMGSVQISWNSNDKRFSECSHMQTIDPLYHFLSIKDVSLHQWGELRWFFLGANKSGGTSTNAKAQLTSLEANTFWNLSTYISFSIWATQQNYQPLSGFSQENWKFTKQGALIRAGIGKFFEKRNWEGTLIRDLRAVISSVARGTF